MPSPRLSAFHSFPRKLSAMVDSRWIVPVLAVKGLFGTTFDTLRGVWLFRSAGVTLRNVHIRGCNGSAVNVTAGDYLTPAVLRNVTFSDNKGTDGAVVHMGEGAKLILDNCTLVNNNATGSLIYGGADSELELRNSNVVNNFGSAVKFSGRFVNISSVNFTKNTAPMGAGVVLEHMKGRGVVVSASIRKSSFTGNKVSVRVELSETGELTYVVGQGSVVGQSRAGPRDQRVGSCMDETLQTGWQALQCKL